MGVIIRDRTFDVSRSGNSDYILLDDSSVGFLIGGPTTAFNAKDYIVHEQQTVSKDGKKKYLAIWLEPKKKPDEKSDD